VRKVILCIILISGTITLRANSYADSLKAIAKSSSDADFSIKAMLKLARFYSQHDSLELMFEYSRLIDSSLNSVSYNVSPDLLFDIGLFNEKQSDYDGAIEFYKKAHDRSRLLDEKQVIIESTNRLGYVLSLRGDYDKAIGVILDNLELVDGVDYDKYKEDVYIYSAFIFRNANDFEQAFHYFSEALNVSDSTNIDGYYHVALNEIGNLYNYLGEPTKALVYQERALRIRESLNLSNYISYSYNDIGHTYKLLGDYQKAIEYIIKSISLSKQAKEDFWGSAVSYYNASDFYFAIHDEKKALMYLDSAKVLGQETGLKDILIQIHRKYYDYYLKNENYPKALNHYIISKEYQDTVRGENIQKQINLLNARFQSERKDKEIIKNQAIIKRQRLLIAISTLGAIVVGVFLFGLFKLNQKLKLANSKLYDKNQFIQTQRDEIESQRDEIESQRDLVLYQKTKLEGINQHLTESISYAESIQQTMLPTEEQFRAVFYNYFVVYKPLDIVSGDFYWLYQKENRVCFAVADCTGHGVSGAFMSILGISFLNEIVRYKGEKEPNLILEELRRNIIEALKQKDESGARRDGMDISLCVLDIETKLLHYCGANNPCWIVQSNNSFIELNPNKNTVAINIRMEPFTQQSIQLKGGDCIYLFTDGYADQFGGPQKKRFGSKRLKELLLGNAERNLSVQKEILENAYSQWIGSNSQVDDVTILGIRV
jgi:serine phosphatase RsbU (regulator of sigma subunit)